MKPFLSFLGVFCLLRSWSSHAADVPAKKPNIIFILADDPGCGDLGPFGQKIIHTPKLDKLAREGMKFTQHYAGSPVWPRRAAF